MRADTEYIGTIGHNPFAGGTIETVVPRTIAQEEILSSMAMDQDASLCYNEVLAIDLNGALNIPALEFAISLIIKKHDALRAVFSSNGKAMMIRSESNHKIIYLQSVNVEELKLDAVTTPFDLVNGPCIKSTLVQIKNNHHVLILATHHIICDGWSLAIMLSELSQTYNDICEKRDTEFDVQENFADYAYTEYKNGVNPRHRDYWKKEFSYPIIKNNFPTDFPRTKYRTFKSARIDFIIPSDLVQGLKKLGAKNGASFYSSLVSVFNVLLFNITKSPEQVVGLSCAAQPAIGQHALVGHLVNLLPLRTETIESFTFTQLLKLSKTKMLDAFEHHDYSYGLLVKELSHFARVSGEMPILNTVFNIDQQAPDQGLSLNNLFSSYQSVPRIYENFEIFINAVSREDSLILECQYNTSLFRKETIHNWLESYSQLMRLVINDPDISLGGTKLSGLFIPGLADVTATSPSKEHSYFSEIEEQIINIWKEVLGIKSITSTDNFFNVGGHSLLAIEVAEKISIRLKTNITIKDIFQYDDVQALAAKIGETKQTVNENALPIIFPANKLSLIPVTNNQMQVWYLEEIFPGTTMHNLPSAIRLKSKVEVSILEKAFDSLINRHDILRTVIISEGNIPTQKILKVAPIEIIEETASIGNIHLKLNHDAKYVFDKKKAPLFRVKLYRLAQEDYVLFFMAHHAIWDGWSFDIFFEELNTAYSTIKNNGIASFKALPEISYADYSVWLQSLIENKLLDGQFNYWKEKLKGALPVLELPADFKRPLKINHEGGAVPFTLSEEQTSKVRAYAKNKNNSVFNVLLTVYKELLSVYSGLDDIIVGAPVRGRVRPEMLNTIGYFVNAVALRSSFKKEQSFEEKLKVVTATCLEAFENQLLPFQLVLNGVTHERDEGRTSIFQTFFSYQDVNNRLGLFDNAAYSQINIEKASTHTDLDLWVKANDKKIEGAFEYRKDLFQEVTIARMLDCFLSFIDKLGDESVASLPIAQKNLIFKTWNETVNTNITAKPFIYDFIDMAKLYPNKIAIESTTQQLTYGELDSLSTCFANKLIAEGVLPGDLVGISMSRTPQLLIALLATLKTGAGYVPLDPGFPQDRLNYMIESATPKILITEEKISKRFKQNIRQVFLVDIGENHSENFPVIDGNKTAYVIYTSGSTGMPKGVEISHQSVSNFLHSMINQPLISCDDKILAVTTFSFDIAVLELFLPLISGAGIFLASSAEVIDGVTLKKIIESKKITMMQATPSTYKLLISAGWKGTKDIRLLCGGEAFPFDLAQTLIPMVKEVWNMYGPTETTVWSTCKKLNLADQKMTIGRPIDNTTIFILDEKLRPLPIGATGQLFIGGRGLAKGYFKRDDLTAERFIRNPINQNEMIYATGDLARYLHDGQIECLGRNDGQVKVRGYRIELGEIETQLKKINLISDAVVVTSEYRAGDVRIVAYIISKDFNESDIRLNLAKTLPSYMVPNHFVLLTDIPKTLNGKVDKKQLPPFQGAAEQVSVKEVQINKEKLENAEFYEQIRKLWEKVLGKNEVSDEDNFFNIGGNSLLAVQIFSKLDTVFKINLPLASLIEAEDFKAFAQIVMEARPTKSISVKKFDTNEIFNSLVKISNKGDLAPLFCFHAAGGNVLNYVGLIPALKSKRPLYALQSLGLDGKSTPRDSIVKMAIAYIEEIKRAQPEGPYNLAGGSMGGTMALEVAIRLRAAGDEVERLILFDTFGPKFNLKKYTKRKSNYFFQKIELLKFVSKGVFTDLLISICNKVGLKAPLVVSLYQVEMNNYRALWKYRPGTYEGDVHLIRCKITEEGWYSDPLLGWKDTLLGQMHIHEISSSHEEFIESPALIGALTKIIN